MDINRFFCINFRSIYSNVHKIYHRFSLVTLGCIFKIIEPSEVYFANEEEKLGLFEILFFDALAEVLLLSFRSFYFLTWIEIGPLWHCEIHIFNNVSAPFDEWLLQFSGFDCRMWQVKNFACMLARYTRQNLLGANVRQLIEFFILY